MLRPNQPNQALQASCLCAPHTPYRLRASFVPWAERLAPFQWPLDDSAAWQLHALRVPTIDSARYGALLRSSLTAGLPVLLLGDSASGKTSLVRTTALELRVNSSVELAALNCTPHTKASDVQAALEAALVKRGTGYGFM